MCNSQNKTGLVGGNFFNPTFLFFKFILQLLFGKRNTVGIFYLEGCFC